MVRDALLGFVLLVPLGMFPELVVGVERIVKKDGSHITGEVVGFQNGSYTVRVGDSLVEIPAVEVRTIEEGQSLPDVSTEPRSATGAGFDLPDLMERLSRRPELPAEADHRTSFQDAVAALLRGDWDFATRTLSRLCFSEPGWADPQLLTAWIHAARGNAALSLRLAKRLEMVFGDDPLALEVAADVYRRAGFPRHHASLIERALRLRAEGMALDYQLTHLWWPVDPVVGARHWERYLAVDPDLRQNWCREGNVLRQIRVALASEDWSGARSHLDDLQRQFPWMAPKFDAIEIEILESRLRSSETGGRLEEAMATSETLQHIDPRRREEWVAREEGLRAFVLRRGLNEATYDGLRR